MSKRALKVESQDEQNQPNSKLLKLPASKTLEAIRKLTTTFPSLRFYNKIPPVVMLHQIYDLVPSRTLVDREINNLRSKGAVCVFQLGIDLHSRAVILAEDMLKTAEICYPGNRLVAKYLEKIIPMGLIEIERTRLETVVSKAEAKELMHFGYLVLKDSKTYSLSFPNAGNFIRAFNKGRKTLLSQVKKSKYDQILERDLLSKPFEKTVVLGTQYQIHDIVGADLVQSHETTSGRMLKINSNGIKVLKK
ncbi:serine/threonine-protein kinase 19-like [Neocloeon triangulifer]|uniref:serine/threonine-protein kinase 19-like n=1 Tax=Neocloeon triangulifer TaxID=2078957 RepID=UPI00286EC5F5|nr:serine/threonine-protein kinase 19-like [Neocloeon triangulifer]